MVKFRHILLAALAVLVTAGPATAQSDPPDPWESMRFRTGPLAWTPKIQLKSLGWDTNVFNEVDDPRADFIVTLSPQVDWWLRAGRARLHGTNVVDGVYFATYTTERSINQQHQLTFEYPLNRVRPYVTGSYVDTRDRPGFEIDARAAHTEWGSQAGAAVRLSGKTTLELAGRYTSYAFDGDAEFDGTDLSLILNRVAAYGSSTVRYRLTPLTTLTLLGEVGREEFAESPERDNGSIRVLPGVEFDPFALLKGSAKVGYRRLDMKSPAIPDYSGLVAAVNLAYVLMGRTRLSVGVDRDVQFSYEVLQPYYVLTAFSAAIRQSLARGWDIEARGSRHRMDYASTGGAADRLDTVRSVGGGVGYSLSGGSRIGFYLDSYRRRSPQYTRDYDSLRGGLSATYGF
jgi:hypothetical protein